jgi:hypothetical protein
VTQLSRSGTPNNLWCIGSFGNPIYMACYYSLRPMLVLASIGEALT